MDSISRPVLASECRPLWYYFFENSYSDGSDGLWS